MKFTSLNAIINDLLLTIRGARITNSESISRRQVENWIHRYRGVFLSRELDKGHFPNPDYIQEIPFVELEEVPVEGTSLNPGTSFTLSGNLILRTKLEIPKTIDLNYKSGFTSIALPNGEIIQYVPQVRHNLQRYKKYSNNSRIAYLKDNRIYVSGGVGNITHIHLRGIFEIPTEVSRFVNPETSKAYYDLDSAYPVPNDLIPFITQMILEKELNIIISAPSDNKNDSNDGVSQNIERP